MKKNNFCQVIVNAVVANEGKILICRRNIEDGHRSTTWTIPEGSIEDIQEGDEVSDIIEKTLNEKVRKEVGVEISGNVRLIANKCYRDPREGTVLELAFLCEFKRDVKQDIENTSHVKWISSQELNDYEFAGDVRDQIAKGFALLPFMIRRKPLSRRSDNLTRN